VRYHTLRHLSYGEYQFGPGYQSERVYERRIYGDTSRGFGSETCQGVVGQQMNEFGEFDVGDSVTCDETAYGTMDQP
jgi:hypothetical protein